MSETLILNAAVAVATVYENTARGSGKLFWNIVTDTKDRFTAFSRDIVAHLIDGRTPTIIEGRDGGPNSLAYNLTPPLNTMVFFEARATGKVLVPTPAGTPETPVPIPPPNPPGTRPLPDPAAPPSGMAVGTPPGSFQRTPYKPYGGGQRAGGGWKPEDKRPGLVTMNEAYAKDLIVAIIGNSNDLGLRDADCVIEWAAVETMKLAHRLLEHCLDELKTLGFKLEPGA
jgi:hypothetical protein